MEIAHPVWLFAAQPQHFAQLQQPLFVHLFEAGLLERQVVPREERHEIQRDHLPSHRINHHMD